jgi:hypothetical protein
MVNAAIPDDLAAIVESVVGSRTQGLPTQLLNTTITLVSNTLDIDSPKQIDMVGLVMMPAVVKHCNFSIVQSTMHHAALVCATGGCGVYQSELIFDVANYSGSLFTTFGYLSLMDSLATSAAPSSTATLIRFAQRFVDGKVQSSMVVAQVNLSSFTAPIMTSAFKSECSGTLEVRVLCVRWNSGAVPVRMLPQRGQCVDVENPYVSGCPQQWSSSTTTSRSFLPQTPPPRLAAPALISDGVTAAVAVLLSVSTLLSVGSAGGSLSQSLIALGQSQCAPRAVQESTKGGRFLVSPFYALGDHAIVYGNTGLVALLIAAQLAAMKYFRSRDSFNDEPKSIFQGNPRSSQPRIPPPAARARFPNLAILAVGLGLQGLTSTSLRMVFEDAPESIATGVIGLGLSVAALVVWRWTERSKTVQTMRFRPYRLRELRTTVIPVFALPLGRWGPDDATATHGKLRSSVHAGAEWLGSYTSIYALMVSTLTAIPLPPQYCLAIWVPLTLASGAFCVVVIRFRPARVPLVDVFNAVCLASSTVMQLVSGIVAHQEVSDDVPFPGSASLLVALTLVYTGCTILRGVHSGIVFMWERQFRKTNAAAELTDSPLISHQTMSRTSSGGSLKRRSSTRTKRELTLSASGGEKTPTIDSLFLTDGTDQNSEWMLPITTEASAKHNDEMLDNRRADRRVRHRGHFRAVDEESLIVPPLSQENAMFNLAHLIKRCCDA